MEGDQDGRVILNPDYSLRLGGWVRVLKKQRRKGILLIINILPVHCNNVKV